MTKATYRKLKAVWLIGGAAGVAAVVAFWLRMVPIGVVFLAIIVLGAPAAFAGWVLRDQNFEELPD